MTPDEQAAKLKKIWLMQRMDAGIYIFDGHYCCKSGPDYLSLEASEIERSIRAAMLEAYTLGTAQSLSTPQPAAGVTDWMVERFASYVWGDRWRSWTNKAIIRGALEHALTPENTAASANPIQEQCSACDGSGYSADSTESDPQQCPYCGIPMSAIRANQPQQKDEPHG